MAEAFRDGLLLLSLATLIFATFLAAMFLTPQQLGSLPIGIA